MQFIFAFSLKEVTLKATVLILSVLLLSQSLNAQQTKSVQQQNHFWWSVNTTAQVSDKWSVLADAHIRRTNFMANNSFYFLRLGALYNVTKNFSIAAGAGHMWLANKTAATELFTNENRVYQQFQISGAIGKTSTLNRLRIEERWVQKIVNNELTDAYRYTTRFRYMFSLTVPVSKKKYIPSLAIADELQIQMGKDIVYNTFDQNRLFTGIKQQITPSLSFDLGYMLVYQQKLNGYQYIRANTLRWFFYWKPDLRKKHKTHAQVTAFQMLETD